LERIIPKTEATHTTDKMKKSAVIIFQLPIIFFASDVVKKYFRKKCGTIFDKSDNFVIITGVIAG